MTCQQIEILWYKLDKWVHPFYICGSGSKLCHQQSFQVGSNQPTVGMLVKKSDLYFVGALICPLNCVTENRKSAPSYYIRTQDHMCKPQIRSRQRCEEKCRQAKSGGVEPLKNLWSAKEFWHIHINLEYIHVLNFSVKN